MSRVGVPPLLKAPALAERRRRRAIRVDPVDILAVVALGVGALVVVAPFLWILSASLRPITESFALPPRWLPTQFDLESYRRLFAANVPLLQFFANSLKVSGLATLGILVTSSLAGYAFARLRFPYRNLLFGLLLASLMIPIQVTIIPLYIIMRNLGLVNDHLSLILPAVTGAFAPGIQAAFGIFFMRQFFLSFPQDLLDAARVDGAGHFGAFWRIALPLAKPSLAALGIITFLASWNNYFLPLIFLNAIDKMTLTVGIVALREPFSTGSPIILAAVVLIILPVLIVFLVGQKWIVDSMTRAGIRG